MLLQSYIYIIPNQNINQRGNNRQLCFANEQDYAGYITAIRRINVRWIRNDSDNPTPTEIQTDLLLKLS